MATTDLDILIQARDQATQAMGAVQKALDSLGGTATRTSGHVSGLNGMMGHLQSAVSSPLKAVGGLTDMLGKLGLASLGINALASAARGLGEALGIGLNVELENVEAQLLAFTKDGAKSKEILADIRKEADQTPFAFQEMAKATASLMSSAKQANEPLMGLVKTAEILAASNPEQGLQGAAFALREAVSGDFTSIIERFNLPRTMINKLKDEGVPALEIVRQTMLGVGYDADLVSNLAKTASGRWSTFNDTIDSAKAKLSKPLFDKLKEGLEWLQGILDQNKPLIDEWVNTIGVRLGQAVQNAADYLGRLMAAAQPLIEQALPYLGQAVQYVSDHWEEFKGALIGVAAVLAGAAIVGAIAGTAAAIAGLLTPIGLIIAAVALLGAAWAGNWGDIQGKTKAAIEFLTPIIQQLLVVWGGVWDAAVVGVRSAVSTIQGIMAAFGRFWEGNGAWITAAWQLVWGNISTILDGALSILGTAIEAFQAALQGDWYTFGEKLREIWDTAWQTIGTVLRNSITSIVNIAGQLASAVASAISTFDWAGAGRSIIDGVITGIYQNWQSFLNVIQSLMDAAWQAIKGFFGVGTNGQNNSAASPNAMAANGMIAVPQSAGSLGPTSNSWANTYNRGDTVVIEDRASTALYLEQQRDLRMRRLAEAF